MMRYAIALNGSFFNAQRMLHEYVIKAYEIDPSVEAAREARLQKTAAPILTTRLPEQRT
jgi:hypothetical protein